MPVRGGTVRGAKGATRAGGRVSNSGKGLASSSRMDGQVATPSSPPPTTRNDTTSTQLELDEFEVTGTNGEIGNTNSTNPAVSSRMRGINHGVDAPNNEEDRRAITVHNNESFRPISVTRTIGTIVREFMRGPWIVWKKVPENIRNSMWDAFQERYVWSQPTFLVKETFFNKCGDLYASTLYHARKKVMREHKKSNIIETKGLGPEWIREDIWNGMVDEWNKDDWMKKSLAAKENRLTEKDGAITKHTCGSIPIVEHSLRLEEKWGRKPTKIEEFDYTHKRRGKEGIGEYVDAKSKRVGENYVASLTNKYGLDPSSQPEFDHDAWKEATRTPTKGRVYGFGSGKYAKSLMKHLGTSEYQGDSPSEAATQVNLDRLREEMRKEVRQELEQQMEERIRKSNEDMEERVRAMMVQYTKQGNFPTHSDSSAST